MTNMAAINVSSPNLVCVCIDNVDGRQASGSFYHKYSATAVPFSDLNHLLILMEQLMDRLNFPQASTIQRSFFKTESTRGIREEAHQVRDAKDILNETGKRATFVINVQYRQNATWQGRVLWADEGKSCNFRSALELLKLIDCALDIEEEKEKKKASKSRSTRGKKTKAPEQNGAEEAQKEIAVTEINPAENGQAEEK